MAEKFEQWAIVEIMGHVRLAGKVSEQAVGGVNFVRVDVPAIGDQPEFTKLYGAGAIYCISIVSEPVARAAAQSFRAAPVSVYDIPALSRSRRIPEFDEQDGGDDFS